MNLADLASLGSLVSSVAVLVSLLFIGVQIRQSNRNQRSLMQQGRSTRNVELLARLSEPRLSEIFVRIAGNESMTDADYFVLYGYMTSVFWSYEDCFLQFRAGMLDAGSWDSDVISLRRLLRNPAYRAVWRFARDGIGEEYRAFLDGIAAEVRNTAPGNLVNVLKQYIEEERAALKASQGITP